MAPADLRMDGLLGGERKGHLTIFRAWTWTWRRTSRFVNPAFRRTGNRPFGRSGQFDPSCHRRAKPKEIEDEGSHNNWQKARVHVNRRSI